MPAIHLLRFPSPVLSISRAFQLPRYPAHARYHCAWPSLSSSRLIVLVEVEKEEEVGSSGKTNLSETVVPVLLPVEAGYHQGGLSFAYRYPFFVLCTQRVLRPRLAA
jgi:hypothetical protein